MAMLVRPSLVVAALFGLMACSGVSGTGAVPGTDTQVTKCDIEDNRPTAEVRVTNVSTKAGSFDIIVKFVSRNTVLGTGEEYTPVLDQGQSATVTMANMQRDADAVDSCTVSSVTRR